VGTDVEDQIARFDELAVEASQTALTQRNNVIDGERSREPDGTVKAAHFTVQSIAAGSMARVCPSPPMCEMMPEHGGISVTEAGARRLREHGARRSVLSLTAAEQPHVSRFATTSDYYGLLIRNTGNKTSRDVYWRIYLAADARNLQAEGGKELGPITLDGILYRQLTGSFRRPIFPTRSGFIVALKIARESGWRRPVTIRWVLVSEDGRVPKDENTYGSLTIASVGVDRADDQLI
jgi:hypothetical protein